jgi:hypothetical protein
MGKPSLQPKEDRDHSFWWRPFKASYMQCQVANMFHSDADYAVYINTAQELDGSDYGAQSDEAVSWGKIKGSEKPICIESWDVFSFYYWKLKY